jgi:hypothetical protein
MSDILQAARSYYGLADTESCTTQLYTNQAGQACVAFEIPLSNEDFAAIVQRMQNMQQPDTQPDTAIIEGPTVEAMREAYNALSKAEKGRYGSFGKYMAVMSNGIVSQANREYLAEFLDDAIGGHKVAHIDAPEEPEPVSMDAVWLDAKDCSQAQMMHASDADLRSGRHLIQWAMLTDEQKQKAKEAKP